MGENIKILNNLTKENSISFTSLVIRDNKSPLRLFEKKDTGKMITLSWINFLISLIIPVLMGIIEYKERYLVRFFKKNAKIITKHIIPKEVSFPYKSINLVSLKEKKVFNQTTENSNSEISTTLLWVPNKIPSTGIINVKEKSPKKIETELRIILRKNNNL